MRYLLLSVFLFIGLLFANEKVFIPKGSFLMGCSVDDAFCASDEGVKGGTKVFVGDFSIDKYEVSVQEYANCVALGKCSVPKDHALNKYCNYNAKGRQNHPVNCVDYKEAKEYCHFVNGRLPYEAEWEKAARANSNTPYPWGKQASCKHAILDDGKTFGSVANEPDGCGEDRTWPVGSKKANAYGLFDMHGNVGEWTENFYAPDALKEYAKGNLAYPANSPRKVVRGGSWDENKENLRSSFRNVKFPVSGQAIYGSIGFRCVYP